MNGYPERVAHRILVAALTAVCTLGWFGIVTGRAFSTIEIVGLAFASLFLAVLVLASWE